MHVVLIQTPWSNAAAREFKGIAVKYALYPPIGLLYLASYVDQCGHSSSVIDLEIEELLATDLVNKIINSGAGIIGLSSTSPVFHLTRRLAKFLKEHIDLPIVLGGAHVTILKEEAFTEEFDYAVIGEGEKTLAELMDALSGKKNLADIHGLIYRENGHIKANVYRPFIIDLDSLPIPSRGKIDPLKYVFEIPGKGIIPVGTIELTRGCPFHCVFCSEPLISGRRLRKRSPKKVVDEMMQVKERFGIDHFFMLDSTLTIHRPTIEGLCSELISRGSGITWEGQTRANLVDDKLLKLMKNAGLVRLSFGVESANTEVLKLMRKEVDIDSMRTAFRLCKKLGISTLCGLMMGNPGDTKKTILESALFIRSIPEVRYAPLAIAIPYPGTELAYMAENHLYGLKLLTKDYDKYSRYAGGVMEVNGMKPSELIKLQRRMLLLMHSTPSKIIGLVKHFGFKNIVSMFFKFIKNEIITMLGFKEPVFAKSISESNTTLKSLGWHYSDQSGKRKT